MDKLYYAQSIFCVGLGVFILVKSAMEDTIKQFYEAADTSLLLSSLSPSTVFGFKLVQLIATSLLGMVIWLFPPWIAFGRTLWSAMALLFWAHPGLLLLTCHHRDKCCGRDDVDYALFFLHSE